MGCGCPRLSADSVQIGLKLTTFALTPCCGRLMGVSLFCLDPLSGFILPIRYLVEPLPFRGSFHLWACGDQGGVLDHSLARLTL